MEGTRVAKSESGGNKTPWIVAVGVLAAAALVYLGLCVWAMSRDAVLPNVSVSGIDVSNMTLEQAKSAVETAMTQQGGDVTLTLNHEGFSESMSGAEVTVDVDESVQGAWQIGRGSFFTAGPQLLGHMLGASSQTPLVLPEDDPALSDLIDRMEQAVSSIDTDHGYYLKDDQLFMTKGAPVVTIDWDQVRTRAREILLEDFATRFSQGQGKISSTQELAPSRQDSVDPDFEAIHRELAAEPKDAALDLETMEISDHAVGVDFDVQALKTAYQQARAGETISVPVTITQPKVTREDLEGMLFRDILGEATSTVSGSAARKSNVKLAAAACNEKILLPGETFSYNDSTGPRTAARGYQSAPAYYNGATVQEVGGGVCQPSSTIYYAVLHTNLEITERHNHRYAVGYVPDGMDATVSYGTLDFKFTNNTDYPIKIVTSSYDAGGARKLNVKIYGTNVDGIRVEPTAGVFNVVAPTVQYVADGNVARGSLVLDREQNAYRGRSAQTYRTIYAADGSVLEKQDMGLSVYKMRPTVYHYNPADGDPTTWVNGQPPANPGTATDPGTTADPGTTTDPGPSTDPGTTPDPGTTDPGPAPEPEPDPGPPPTDSGLHPIDPNAQEE